MGGSHDQFILSCSHHLGVLHPKPRPSTSNANSAFSSLLPLGPLIQPCLGTSTKWGGPVLFQQHSDLQIHHDSAGFCIPLFCQAISQQPFEEQFSGEEPILTPRLCCRYSVDTRPGVYSDHAQFPSMHVGYAARTKGPAVSRAGRGFFVCTCQEYDPSPDMHVWLVFPSKISSLGQLPLLWQPFQPALSCHFKVQYPLL